MTFTKKLGLSVLSGLLFALAWPERGFAPLIFVAFVPLLLIAANHKKHFAKTLQITLFAYVAFLIWNVLTTYWVYYASDVGGIVAMTLLSLFFTIVFTAFYFAYKYLPGQWGLLTLPVFWIAFEKFHLEWDLSWPWLTLGNVFSEYYQFVQWYEYTGVFGGSLWILIVNLLIFRAIVSFQTANKRKTYILVGIGALVLIAPTLLSFVRYSSYTETVNPISIVVVQPNIDPYNEKFMAGTYEAQTNKFIKLAKSKLDSNVQYVIGPETAISAGIDEKQINIYTEVVMLRNMLSQYPKAALVTGASTFKFYQPWETPSATADKSHRDGQYYDSYNTAIQLDTSENIQYSHKSKLVPGAERMPFMSVLGSLGLDKFAIDLGGASGTLGSDTIQNVFINNHVSVQNGKAPFSVAPSICYESVYGEYMGKFIQRGAGLIFIITNDGWWKNTPGHRQHCSYARLRAIESRRSIARSANTGISCFVNQRGEIFQATEYWQPAVIKQTLNANYELTFYTRHGDYIARICNWLLLLLLSAAIVLAVRVKRRKRKKAKSGN